MANEFYVGTRVATEADFRVAGSLTDPTTVRCKVRAPAGSVTTYEYPQVGVLEREAEGSYRCEFSLATTGTWGIRWEGIGAVEAVEETSVVARVSNVI